MSGGGADEVLDVDVSADLKAVLYRLHAHLMMRATAHDLSDSTTGTAAHLVKFCGLLEQIASRVRFRAVGRLILKRQAQFDINKLYRPTKSCRQKQFEKERSQAQLMWQEIVNFASLIATNDEIEAQRCT